MLWENYVFRRGNGVEDLWDEMFSGRPLRILYIAGGGFDDRVKTVLDRFRQHLHANGAIVERAELALVRFTNFALSAELVARTETNIAHLESVFSALGTFHSIPVGTRETGEEVSETEILARDVDRIVNLFSNQTDIILDVSSLPRALYLGILVRFLGKLIPDRTLPDALA